MKIFRKRDKVASAPKRFIDTYADRLDLKLYHGKRRERVSVGSVVDALREITESGAYGEPEIVDALGNDSWTRMECDVCTKDCELLASFDTGCGGSVDVCEDCLEAALEMLYQNKEKNNSENN